MTNQEYAEIVQKVRHERRYENIIRHEEARNAPHSPKQTREDLEWSPWS